jgi:predicted hydrocarbon binding protein
MTVSRKEFFKKACISGACLCGFSQIALLANNNKLTNKSQTPDTVNKLMQDWLSNLLSGLGEHADKENVRDTIKKCAIVHYSNLNMDELLSAYIGNLDKFINFIEEKWGWKISWDKLTKTIIADENKNYCVCPIVSGINKKFPALCYCSEGFAEKMFSAIAKKPVSASVISSIQRGDKSCKYQIVLS